MEKKKLQILVCCHKADPAIRTEEPYLPIQVGKALHPDLDLGFQNDNEGDNISTKNSRWCELTALYWGWKNIHNVDYLGMCHYRRYFDYNINSNNIDKLLRRKDILLLERTAEMCSVANRYMELVSMEDVYIFFDILLKVHPEYKKTISEYCFNSNLLIRCTIFIAKKEIYDDFCMTFFPILEEVEKIIRPHGYSRMNRCIAYLGELSLGIYVSHKKYRMRFLPVSYYPEGETHSLKSKLKKYKVLRRVKDNLTCFVRVVGFKLTKSLFPNRTIYDAVVVGLKSDGYNINWDNFEHI